MIFGKKYFKGETPPSNFYFLGKEKIDIEKQYKYLGVLFDSTNDTSRPNDINFKAHAVKYENKCNSRNSMLRNLVSDARLPKKLRCLVHEAFIHSAMLYGSESWSWGFNPKLEALDTKSARNFANIFSWGFGSDGQIVSIGSGSACKALHGRVPLTTKRDLMALMFWFRTVSLPAYRIDPHIIDACLNRNSFPNRIKRVLTTIRINYATLLQEIRDRLHSNNIFSESEFRGRIEELLYDRDKTKILQKLARSKMHGVLINNFHDDLHVYSSSESRCRILVGADSLSILVNNNVKNDFEPKCPGCGAVWSDKSHCIFFCKGWKACREKLIRTTNNKCREIFSEGGIDNCRQLLAPNEWNNAIKSQINLFCKEFDLRTKMLLLCKSKKGEFQPGIAKFVRLSQNDFCSPFPEQTKFSLNENVIGSTFTVEWPVVGWQTVIPIEFNPFSGFFKVTTIGVDIEFDPAKRRFDFMTTDTVDLNSMFHNNQIRFSQNPFRFPSRHQVRKLLIFNSNIVGKTCGIKIRGQFRESRVNEFREINANKWHHLVTINNQLVEVDLHYLLSRAELITNDISPHVFAHIRAHLQSRPQGREVDAHCRQRVAPRGGSQDSCPDWYGRLTNISLV